MTACGRKQTVEFLEIRHRERPLLGKADIHDTKPVFVRIANFLRLK